MSAPTDALGAILDGPSRWHTLDHRREVTSTNDVAAAALRDGTPPGLVVVADHQTAGRGRRGRTWQDRPAGASLLVSVTVAAPATRTLVPLAAGLAVVDAVAAVDVCAGIKWPNDVLVGDRKLAGLLAEGHADGLVVGIGTNVDRPTPPIEGATSIGEHLPAGSARPDRWTVLAAQLRALDGWFTRLDRGEDDAVLDAVRARCVTLGRDVTVDLADGTRVQGRAVDVGPEGQLVVAADSTTHRITAGDVHHVRPG